MLKVALLFRGQLLFKAAVLRVMQEAELSTLPAKL